MHNPECTHCRRRPVDDPAAHACPVCGDQTREQLHAIADATSAGRDVANGQSRHGGYAGGGTGRIPVNLGAVARLDAVQTEITTWARIVHTRCGGRIPTGDPLQAGARYLAGHIDWLRYQTYASEAMTDIAACARIITALVAGPGERRWLGQCGADTDAGLCPADLRAPLGASSATCRACGTRHDVRVRRDHLDGVARGYDYTARDIGKAYGIPEGTIRSWASRREIAPRMVPLPPGVEGPLLLDPDEEGRPVYNLGAVLDLAAAKAAKRAEREAKARRRAEEEADLDEAEIVCNAVLAVPQVSGPVEQPAPGPSS